MNTGFSRRAWVFIALVLCFAPAALARTISSKSTGGFGQDTNVCNWLLSPNCSATPKYNVVTTNGITVNEQVICNNQDLSVNLCTSGAYSFLYQVESSGPFVATFSRLSGFAFDNTTPTFGLMACDTSGNNTIAVCGYDSAIASQVSFDSPNATLSVSTPTAGSLTYVTFVLQETQPTGLPPIPPMLNLNGVSLTPTSLTFGSQAVGIAGPPQTLTLTNPFGASVSLTPGALSSGFAGGNTCGVTALAGATCAFSVWSAPAAASFFSGTQSLSAGADSASLNAYGSPPGVSLFPATLTFGTQTAGGTATAVQRATLTNNSGTSFTIGTISPATADPNTNNIEFALQSTSTCAPSLVLVNGAACTLDVGFPNGINLTTTLGDTGTLTGTITVTDKNSSNTYTLALQGFAGAFSAITGNSLIPTNLNFGNQALGTASAPQTLTFTNTTASALNIVNVNSSADFSAATGTCVDPVNSVNLPAGSSCTVDVAFSPTAYGTSTGAITIADDRTDGTQIIAVSGVGGPSALSPAFLDFPPQAVGTTSQSQTVGLFNNGKVPLTISAIMAGTADFTVQNDSCPISSSTLAVGLSCSVVVSFVPTATGPRKSSLVITDDATYRPHTVTLTGVGMAASLTPPSLTFPSQSVGVAGAPQVIKLANLGSATLNIWEVAFLGTNASDFSRTSTCGSTLAAGNSCTISVTFTPAATGARTASLVVSDDGGGSPQSVLLAGSGVVAGPVVSLSSTSLSFPNQVVSTTSPTQTVVLGNQGSGPLTISSIAVAGADSGDFAIPSDTCPLSPSTLAAGNSCAISVTFTPLTTGPLKSSVSITDNAAGSPQIVILTGVGAAALTGTGAAASSGVPPPGSNVPGAAASLSPSIVSFGNQAVGAPALARTVIFKNVGRTRVWIRAITFSARSHSDFAETNDCGPSLAAGTSCTLQITFKPRRAGSQSAVISIVDHAPGRPHQVRVKGVGVRAAKLGSGQAARQEPERTARRF
ncbi:MAG TPA: choice-of-anchor D domain-containing protein [Terriglobia bacterium]|nr:choice-of-anchor D domain-containing protein [Terriglobia bacterium]